MSPRKRPKATARPDGHGQAPRTVAGGAGSGSQTPRTVISPDGSSDEHPRFSFRYADRAYPQDWHDPDHAINFLEFVHSFGRSTWSELRTQWTGTGQHRRKRYHSQEFDTVCDEAQQRIAAAQLDQVFNELMRYRTNGLGRVWGFERERTFYVLWWDPNHVVYSLDN